jgi:Cu2+-exporting ATPase
MARVTHQACYHCGQPVLEAGRWRATVLGAQRGFCCAGCLSVAATIVAGGFAAYYATRAGPADRPGGFAAADLYDDPLAQKQFTHAPGPGQRSATLILDRIRCAACLWLNERVLRELPGVLRAEVNYTTRRAQVTWDPSRTRLSAVIEAIRAIGYDAYPYDPQRQSAIDLGARRKALWQLFVAGFGAMQVMMYAFPAYLDEGSGTLSPEADGLMRWASLLLTLPVVVFSCGPFFSGAWRELRRARPGMDTPLALGIGAGFAASAWATLRGSGAVYFDSIAMLVFLLLAARFLEMAARQRAARALDRLARWSPSRALRLCDDLPQPVPAHELAVGDRALVPAGELIPADGVVERGCSSVDESLLTGEPLPLPKTTGSALAAGTLNLEQALVMRVTRAGADTRAAAIARLVERAAAARPRLVAAADRLAHLLTWVVLAVALVAGLHAGDGWVAIAVLVATCPCALALAAPIALTQAAGDLLSRGAALTRANALETLASVTDVVLDKTGTLTSGRFQVVQLRLLGALGEGQCRSLARALEAHSRHPLARAFSGGGSIVADAVSAVAGAGIEGKIAGRRIRIGSEAFCGALAGSPLSTHLPSLPREPTVSCTAVCLADESGWLAVFYLEDALRPEAEQLVAALRAAGVRLHLVSGDRSTNVALIARRLGIARHAGGASPQEKFDYVARLQGEGRVVAMIGDGLNDAPVLARADVSFAMGGGADAAQREADVVLLGDALDTVPAALALARRAMRIVRQNFAWAIAYNLAALPLAAAGWIGPWEAAVGMAASSFIVVLNALRVSPPRGTKEPWKASHSSSPSPSPSYS